MQPKIIDADTGKELWTGADCANHIGVSYAAWRNYSANHHTPEHVAMILGRTRLWLGTQTGQDLPINYANSAIPLDLA